VVTAAECADHQRRRASAPPTGRYSNPFWAAQIETLAALIEGLRLDPPLLATARPRYQRVQRLTEPEIDELVELYLGGATMVEVGEQLRINRHTVGKHLADRGVRARRNRSGQAT
jgi:hypothetical protein